MRRESSSSPSTSSSRRYWSWPRSFSSRNNPPASTTESAGIFWHNFDCGWWDYIFNHLVLRSKVLSKMLPRLNRQPSRHKWRSSANLPMHPLWPSAAAPIVAPLTSSSIIRRRFGCQKVVLLYSLLVCIYYPPNPCGLSNASPVGAFNAARRYCT